MGPETKGDQDMASALAEVEEIGELTEPATKDAKDSLSDEKKEEASEAPKTYTQEEFDKAVKRATSAQSEADKRASKAEKELGVTKEALVSLQSEMAQLREEVEQRELDALDGDTDQQALVKQRQADRKRRAELEAKERELEKRAKELDGLLEDANKVKQEQAIRDIATAHSIDAKELEAKVMKFNITDPEGIEEMATLMEGKAEAPATDSEDSAVAQKPRFKPDSGRTVGGGKRTKEQISADPDASFEELEDLLKKETNI